MPGFVSDLNQFLIYLDVKVKEHTRVTFVRESVIQI
jgi:hypothetical protein